ncbi:MAG: Gfo/Idh/MocA family oxidoreductase [Bryobacterales bacterium]|nr:Gfo/Idh/MocA family oxidoreductase [Bryobacterales bacterium]
MPPQDVTRRLFLAGAGTLATSALSAAPSDRTTVGMIAVGARAHQLLEAMQRNGNVEIVSVFDGYQGRMERAVEKTGGRARRVKSYQDILSDPSIEAVTIASPDHWHARQCIEALEAGKDVYCEKPLTYTVDEGLEIAAAVKKTGKILQVGSQGISTPNQIKAREYVQSGKLGKITMVRAYYNRNSKSGAWLYPIPPDASRETVDWDLFLGSAPKHDFSLERFFRWRCYKDYSGGIATDLFVHLCTTIHYVMGAKAPSEVVAFGDLYRWKKSRNVPDTLNAILRYPEGFTVNLSSTFNNESAGTGFEFLGTEGSISLGYRGFTYQEEVVRENNAWITTSWPTELEEEYTRKHPEEQKRPDRPEPEEFMERGASDTRLHLAGFIDCVRTRKQPVEDVWAGHRAAACAHMINASAETGAVIRWDDDKNRIARA